MALIDLDKFVESLMWMWDSYKNNPLFKNPIFNDIKLALDKQGLVYKDGKIVKTQRRVSAEAKEDGYSESEDDRIRETLIDYFENYKTQEEIGIKTFFGIQTDDIIAWLEKQGEQKSNTVLDIEIPFGAKDSELQEVSYYIPEGFHAEIEGDKVVIKKGKQKPIEWKQENREELTKFENAMMHIGGSFFGENAGLDPNDTAVIKEQAELLLELAPKQKWSEEDEEMIEGLNNCLDELEKENGWRYIYVNSKNVELNKVRNWLKSFKKE